jgi:hypothetical protein
MRVLRELQGNPFFQREFRREHLRACTLALLLMNGGYVLLFLGARLLRDLLPGSGSAHLRAEFEYRPWLFAGAALLSLCVHWLVPPWLLRAARDGYDLPSLSLMVRERASGEEWWRGRVAACLAPAVLGALPLFLGLPALALFAPQHAHPAAVVVGGGLIWAGLCAGATLWVALRCAPAGAALWAYGLTSLALPFAIGAVAATLAYGCSTGRPDAPAVFPGVAAFTWNLLALGLAGAFWDRAVGRLFPEKRRPLWQELPPGPPPADDDDRH